MTIVHLNAYDRHGGAERLAADLINLQNAAGHRSIALVGKKNDARSAAIAFETDPDLERRDDLLRNGWPDYEYRGSHQLMLHPAVQNAEVIHAHNLYGGYFHPFSLIALSHFRPVVWSIHDMQPLTGYCSHALDCGRWEIGCGVCPDLTRPGPHLTFDNTAALWRDKQLIAQNSRLWVAGASSWMTSQLSRSLLRDHPIHLIPNGIDTETFRPGDRLDARRKLGLPERTLIAGSLARSGVFAHPWKGGPHARAVITTLRERYPDFLFLNLGASEPAPEPWIRALAPTSAEALRDALNALDFFLCPSIADTAPLSVLEAMACGVPVVGFRVGGLPDMITAEVGILVEANKTSQLIEAALMLANDETLRVKMSMAARARTVKNFDRRQMAMAYEDLYRTAIAAHPAVKHTPHNVSAVEEIRREQEKIIGLEAKLSEFRSRRSRDDSHIAEFFRHWWLRLGVRLGLVRGPMRNWLQLKERERRRRLDAQKSSR